MNRTLDMQVAEDLLQRISTGVNKVGERLPSEEIFAKQLGISRSTLRLAFTQLERKGIIRRRKRGGTEIISDKPVEVFNMRTNGLFDLVSLGEDSGMLINKVVQVQQDEVEHVDNYADVAASWTLFDGVRFDPEHQEPFACIHAYVPDYYSEIAL